jgi:hypothetical protein
MCCRRPLKFLHCHNIGGYDRKDESVLVMLDKNKFDILHRSDLNGTNRDCKSKHKLEFRWSSMEYTFYNDKTMANAETEG